MRIIFIHGAGGCSLAWRYQTRAFENSDAVDLPGHPDGELRTSVEGYADWLKGYAEKKGYKDLVPAGHSMGGAAALMFALKYPDNVKAVVTIGSGAKLRVHPKFLEELENAVKGQGEYDPMEQIEQGLAPELKEALRKKRAESGPAASLNDMRACDSFDIIDRLEEIKAPVLALCGSEDIMTPPKYSRFLAEKLPRGRVEIVPGGSHMVFAEKPDAVNRAIQNFLESV